MNKAIDNPKRAGIKHLYLFTLEIIPLEIGRTYKDLPSHLTLMSRFLSELSFNKLSAVIQPLFARTPPLELTFGKTTMLGPKKLTVQMVHQPKELKLHNELRQCLDAVKVEYQYPQFTGQNHKPHVTKREGVEFELGDKHIARMIYLIQVINGNRVVRAKFELKEGNLSTA